MTVGTTHISNAFTPNGSQTDFNFTFRILNITDLEVSIDDVIQSSSLYAVILNDSGVGGTVSFLVAPTGTAGEILRVTPKLQSADFGLVSKLNTDELEGVLDRLMLIIQELSVGVVGPQGPQGIPGDPGDVTGPVSSTNNALALWDGTGGNVLKDGPAPTPNGNFLKVVGGVWTSSTPPSAVVPSGACMLWPFDPAVVAIPTGWVECKGQSVTINTVSRTAPDPRGKYLLCGTTDDAGSSGYTGSTVRPGTIAGTLTHQHTQQGTVTSANKASGGNVNVSNLNAANPPVGGGNVGAANNYSVTGTSHNHDVTLSGNTAASTEASRAIEVALILIIKVDE